MRKKGKMSRGRAVKFLTCSAGSLALSLALFAIPAFAEDGWQQDDSQNWYYMENDKKLANQWLTWPDGTMRYVGGNGLIVTDNWVSFEGSRYRVKADGSRYENEWFSITNDPTLPSSKASTLWYYAGSDGKILVNGWYEIGGKQYYFYAGGNSPRKTNFVLEEKRYYVDENGARLGPGWFSVDNIDSKGNPYTNWYYAQEDGSLLTNGWHVLDGVTYYFDASGNSYRKRWFNLEDARYYVDETGALKTGWFSITGTNSNGQEYTNWYHADSNGSVWRGGWGELDGKWYYFDANGLSYRKRWFVDGKKRYYLDEDGVLKNSGWFSIDSTNANTGEVTHAWYYAQADGDVLKDGYHEIEGKNYYFDANGYSYRKRWMTDNSGNRRYLGEDGALYENEWFSVSGLDSRNAEYTYWYYAGKDGKILMDGWKKVGDNYYRFNTSGVMQTGWISDDDDSAVYYCGDDGARVYGWQYLLIPDSWRDDEHVQEYLNNHGEYAWFYFNSTSGRKRFSDSGYKEVVIDGKQFCVDDDGIIQIGWVKVSSKTPAMKGYKYFYNPASEEDTAWQLGERVESSWLQIMGPDDENVSGDAEWYYFSTNGEPVCANTDQFLIKKIQQDKYAFDMYGNCKAGLIEISGSLYYFGEENGNRKCVTGKCLVEDGIDSGKSEYYFDTSGKGVTGIRDGYAYYKGKLQKADKASKYEVFDIPGEGKRLLNSSGKVMKNTKVTDGNDNKWEVGSGGSIKVYGTDEVSELVEPEPTVTY